MIKQNMVVRAETNNIVRCVRTVVRCPERPDMGCLGIGTGGTF